MNASTLTAVLREVWSRENIERSLYGPPVAIGRLQSMGRWLDEAIESMRWDWPAA